MKFPNNDVINSAILVIGGFALMGLLAWLGMPLNQVGWIGVVAIFGTAGFFIGAEIIGYVKEFLNDRKKNTTKFAKGDD